MDFKVYLSYIDFISSLRIENQVRAFEILVKTIPESIKYQSLIYKTKHINNIIFIHNKEETYRIILMESSFGRKVLRYNTKNESKFSVFVYACFLIREDYEAMKFFNKVSNCDKKAYELLLPLLPENQADMLTSLYFEILIENNKYPFFRSEY